MKLTSWHLATVGAVTSLVVTIAAIGDSVGCVPDTCTETRWGYSYGAFDAYDVSASRRSPSGIMYDPSGLPISGEMIDRLTHEVETCLAAAGRMTGQIDRGSFVVKVARDWVHSCDGTQQLLPVLSGAGGCKAKGLTPTDSCPCRWRAGIQCPNVLVVTPSFYLYKDVLIRFVTDSASTWTDTSLALCASPTTPPLGDGSDVDGGP